MRQHRAERALRRRVLGKRWALMAAAIGFPAMAAPAQWHESLFASDAPSVLAPMGFETAGESFPGSAFYYLENSGYAPLPIEAEIHSDAESPPGMPGIDPGQIAPTLRATGSSTDIARAQRCLQMAIYYEAASESDAGQKAVAQVVLNRVSHPSYPNTVCGVVFQGSERSTGCQFSFTCDGSLARRPAAMWWDRAGRVARQALAGAVYAPVGLATHYHTVAIHPYWADSLYKVTTIGAHIFYRWRGAAGQKAAFRVSYRGGEPAAGPHPRAATAVVANEADPVALARAYESSLAANPVPNAGAARSAAPAPAYSAAVSARGGDELFRASNLPQGGAFSADLERSGQWLRQP